jgi:hypothetical protein
MKIISEAKATARRNAQAINNVIKRDSARITAICKALEKSSVNVQYVSIDSSSFNVSITGSRADLDVMFGILRRHGLQPARRPEEKETYYGTFWYFGNESRAEYVFVSFSSTSCKRVQIGTEMKEIPVYETVCEG